MQGAVGADWAKEMGVKRVYVLDDSEVYGKGIAESSADAPRSSASRCVGHESIDAQGARSSESLMTKIKEQDPDLVYFGGTTQ